MILFKHTNINLTYCLADGLPYHIAFHGGSTRKQLVETTRRNATKLGGNTRQRVKWIYVSMTKFKSQQSHCQYRPSPFSLLVLSSSITITILIIDGPLIIPIHSYSNNNLLSITLLRA